MPKPKAVPAPARVAAFRSGVDAEARAAETLQANGYCVLARRFKTAHGEIDLIVRKDNLIAFVEVKARRRIDDAAYAVTPRQQKRIIAAATTWLAAHPEFDDAELRFDAVLIAPNAAARHLEAAFDASE
jgi:putative endonuclease